MLAPAADGLKMLSFNDPLHQAAHEFLVKEAYVQDRRDFDTWLSMMTSDVLYRVPVTATLGASPHKAGRWIICRRIFIH